MERIIAILEKIDRPGMANVIEYMRKSNYATARCNSHHIHKGGLVEHSLEVYNFMMEHRSGISEESCAICAFFHDLGKTRCEGHSYDGHHPRRSLAILRRCGLQLTPDEKTAIGQHHSKRFIYLIHPMRVCLSLGDMDSTRRWKSANPRPEYKSLHRGRKRS